MRKAIFIAILLLLCATAYAGWFPTGSSYQVPTIKNSSVVLRGPVGAINTTAVSGSFKSNTAGPYLTTKVKSSPKISAPVVFNMKRNATKTYVSTREYIKTKENYVAGVKDVFGSQALPPAGSQLCCGVKALKAYDSYLRLKCVPSNLDVSGWINACKGVRGLFTYGPFCQTSQTVCVMPKSIKK